MNIWSAIAPLVGGGTSDQVKIAVFNGIITFLGTIVSGVIVVLLAKINKKASDAAAAAQEVKEDLAHVTKTTKDMLGDAALQIKSIKSTGETTHGLVNNAMSKQLQLTARSLRRIAELTKDPKDIEAAQAAEFLIEDRKEV